MARERPRSVRRDERGSESDGALPVHDTRAESDAGFDRIVAKMSAQGFGLWAVEVPHVAEFIGFVGLNPADALLGRPVFAIGWRLAARHWGHGYATEGARASLAYAFDVLGQDEIVSFTTTANQRSRHVMERLGLMRRPRRTSITPAFPRAGPVAVTSSTRSRVSRGVV